MFLRDFHDNVNENKDGLGKGVGEKTCVFSFLDSRQDRSIFCKLFCKKKLFKKINMTMHIEFIEGIKLGRGAKWTLPCSIPGRARPGQWPGFLDTPETLMSQYASQVSRVFASESSLDFVFIRVAAQGTGEILDACILLSRLILLHRLRNFSRDRALVVKILFASWNSVSLFVRVDYLPTFHRFELKFRILVHTPRDCFLWRCFFWNLQFVSNGLCCRGCGRLAVLGFGLVLWRVFDSEACWLRSKSVTLFRFVVLIEGCGCLM